MSVARDVFDRHMTHELEGDLDGILSDYATDAIVVGPGGIGVGHDHIRANYEAVLPLLGSLEVTNVLEEGDVVYVNFRSTGNGQPDLVGTDTFVIRDDLIQVHTFYAHSEPAS
jgi:hypothetical protein